MCVKILTFGLLLLFDVQDALEPYMSRRTVALHWGKHHRDYVEGLNKQLASSPLYGYTLEDLIIKEAHNNGNPLPEYNNAAQVICWWFIEVCLHIPFASCHLFSFFVHLPIDEVFRASTFCLLICRSGTITSSGNQCNQKVVAYLREVFCIRLKRILACLLISGKVFCMFTRLLFPLMYTVNLYEFNRLGLHL